MPHSLSPNISFAILPHCDEAFQEYKRRQIFRNSLARRVRTDFILFEFCNIDRIFCFPCNVITHLIILSEPEFGWIDKIFR